jgi:pimeloyl-ACP methyl ester carboxylesterase
MADMVMTLWFSQRYREQQPAAVAGWRNMLTRTPYDGYAGTVAALRDADFTARAGDIRVPAMALVGAEDMATTPELMREMARLMGDIRCEVVEGAGHLPCIEKPKEVARLIGDFATEHDLA